MKKFIWCVAVCAAMFTSCLSDVEPFEPQVESEGFKASFEEMSSRAHTHKMILQSACETQLKSH